MGDEKVIVPCGIWLSRSESGVSICQREVRCEHLSVERRCGLMQLSLGFSKFCLRGVDYVYRGDHTSSRY